MGGCFSSSDPGQGTHEARPGSINANAGEEALQLYMGYSDCTSKIELRLACKKLKNKDGLTGKSDPFCVLLEQDPNGSWLERGRTEVVVNQANPEFVRGLAVSYNFELLQRMRVDVYDADTKASSVAHLSLPQQDFLGSMEFTLADVVKEGGAAVTGKLVGRAHGGAGGGGSCTVSAEEVVDYKKSLTVTVKGHHLKNKDGPMGTSDPFLQICRPKEARSGVTYQPVYQSAVVQDSLNPTWPALELPLGRLCGGDMQSGLLFRVLDFDGDGRHDLIGKALQSVSAVTEAARSASRVPLGHPKSKSKVTGELSFSEASIAATPSFIDYLHAGLDIEFSVAVDFTLSNGNPSEPRSLHYRGGGDTQYEAAIKGVGSVLDFYNKSRLYTAWAFGAAVAGGPVSHCYPLNGNLRDPRVTGTPGVLSAYHSLLQNCKLSGPTNFAPVIKSTHDAARAASGGAGGRYLCLLILTDGAITDMADTISAIVAASAEALSIIIVGIGAADFSSMDKLDSDGGLLRDHRGATAVRDIVQFVPFHKHSGNGASLAGEVLAELPAQIVKHMRQHKQPLNGALPMPAV